MGARLHRFHPFQPDLAALDDPPFDPRKQSWAVAALAALETIAGAIFAIPFLISVGGAVWWLSMNAEARSHHHFHGANVWSVFTVACSTALAATLLWAGLSLMFGWRTRYRAHGALALTILVVVVARAVLMMCLQW